MDIFNFIPGYESTIYATGREPAFVMLLAFILTFIITRGYTRIARVRGWGSASFGGVHTHHMVFGLVIGFVAGALMFAFMPEPGVFLLVLAAAFGVALANELRTASMGYDKSEVRNIKGLLLSVA